MDKERVRRNDRVSMEVPIQVSGMDEMGRAFIDDTWTLQLSRHGASIFIHHKLVPHQELTIRCLGTNKTADAQVVGLIGEKGEGYSFGVEFLDKDMNLWDIEFPPLSESEEAVARVLLECARCRTREVAYLSELEAQVFESNKYLSRPCKRCTGVSLWKESHGETPTEQVPWPKPPVLPTLPPPANA